MKLAFVLFLFLGAIDQSRAKGFGTKKKNTHTVADWEHKHRAFDACVEDCKAACQQTANISKILIGEVVFLSLA